MNVRDVQQALFAQGFNPGPMDGIRGRMTIAAVKAFQRHHGLTVDGVVGRETSARLFGTSTGERVEQFAIPMTMPWLQEAFNLLGTDEVPGQGSNQAILGWADNLEIDFDGDDIPWCGLFVAHCLGSQLPEEPLVGIPLRARAWEPFGRECVPPQPGALMVFWRQSQASGKGHVGFYWGEDQENGGNYHVLGGNQGDAVTIRRFPKRRFLTARWPITCPAPLGSPRLVLANGTPITTGEA